MESGLRMVADALPVAKTVPNNGIVCAIAGAETSPALSSKPKNFNV
jgi:hypothetical protein